MKELCPRCNQEPCICDADSCDGQPIPLDDDDLGELDATKACTIDNPDCESCS